MADNKRVDLSGDLDQMLNDVKTATEQVKQQQDASKAKDARGAEKEMSRKISTIIIAAAAVLLVVIAYFVVFARQEPGIEIKTPNPITQPGPTVRVNTPSGVTTNTRTNPLRTTPVVPTNPTNRVPRAPRPANDYEQPSGGRGM
ncbi:MAG: hypothetical protein M1133_15760 [Armatimonadetes bacterium]|nr:hypothetical protein [Armatimonadota bacterium]